MADTLYQLRTRTPACTVTYCQVHDTWGTTEVRTVDRGVYPP